MFIVEDTDLKFIKEKFLSINFQKSLDITYSDHKALESVKSFQEFAYPLANADINKAKAFNVSFLDEAGFEKLDEGSIDCVISRNALSLFKDPRKLFDHAKKASKEGGVFILSDTVVDIEDAYLNSFAFKLNNNHVRFYTIGEIIEFALSAGFVLESYERTACTISLEEDPKYNAFIEILPENILKRLDLIKDQAGKTLGLSVFKGVSILRQVK